MAALIAQDIAPVTAVDLDFSGGNLHTFMGQVPGPGGVLGGLEQSSGQLEPFVRATELPGLRLLANPEVAVRPPNRERRAQLIRALRRLKSPLVLADLPGGSGPEVLDLFIAARRPLLVVLPEPASVESAHHFVRRLYLRRALELARQLGAKGLRAPTQLRAESLKPRELFAWLQQQGADVDGVVAGLERFKLYLLLNQVQHSSDLEVGWSMRNAMHSFFGMDVRFVGAIHHDDQAWWSARRRRLRVREASADRLLLDLESVVKHLLDDVELTPTLE
jgi:MinD-like ATPase involved in chromosome partitioning or flagellar assembly